MFHFPTTCLAMMMMMNDRRSAQKYNCMETHLKYGLLINLDSGFFLINSICVTREFSRESSAAKYLNEPLCKF